jgi:hypothetical protein
MGVTVLPAAVAAPYPASGDTWVLIQSQTASGAAVTFNLGAVYRKLRLAYQSATTSAAATALTVTLNNDVAANYSYVDLGATPLTGVSTVGSSSIFMHRGGSGATSPYMGVLTIENTDSATGPKIMDGWSGDVKQILKGIYKAAAVISRLDLNVTGATFTGGTIYLYGVI